MDIPIETIGMILDGQTSLEDALEQQLLDLREKQKMLQGSMDLCNKMIEDGAFHNLDVDYYLNYVKEEEAKGTVFGMLDDVLEDFANFTQMNRYVGSTSAGWFILGNKNLNRIVLVVWSLLFAAIPAIGIAEAVLDEDGISVGQLVFWIVWIIFYLASFIVYIRAKKNREKE